MPDVQPDARPGRWLIAVIVIVAAIALLLPLAVSAMRDLVALGT